MRYRTFFGVLATLAIVAAACSSGGDHAGVSTTTAVTPTTEVATTTGSTPPAPGCFWSKGITRSVNNTQYPDANATYWYVSYTVPAGATVRLTGDFAHARYQSFNSYGVVGDGVGKDVGVAFDGLADVDITPVAGSVNPFVVGARRDTSPRRYVITVHQSGVAAAPGAAREPNSLYTLAPSSAAATTPTLQEIIYRVYVPDNGLDATGGVGLPAVELTNEEGITIHGDEACAALHVNNTAPANGSTVLDATTYRQLVKLGDPATHPAHDPPTWMRFFNPRFNVLASFFEGTSQQAQIASLDATPRKGYYGNVNVDYGVASVSRHFGADPSGHNVLILRGRAPTTPHTAAGQPVMGDGQLRYWSLCQNESPVTTRVSDCLYDEQIPVGDDGFYTIAISLAADRPGNATSVCGVAWMDWGSGDGVDRPEAGTLILRHMLPSSDFTNTWARVATPGQEASVLGDYLPQGRYLTRPAFEQLGCPTKQ